MTDAPFAIAFTGHRPNKLGGYQSNPLAEKVKSAIRALLIKQRRLHPDLRVISGMALGVDQWVAEEAWYLEIPWIAAVPFSGQERRWPRSSGMHYAQLLKTADEVVLVTKKDIGRSYSAVVAALHRRNRWMVDHCDLLIAVWDGSDGGTSKCVRYARRAGRRIVRIDPKKLDREKGTG